MSLCIEPDWLPKGWHQQTQRHSYLSWCVCSLSAPLLRGAERGGSLEMRQRGKIHAVRSKHTKICKPKANKKALQERVDFSQGSLNAVNERTESCSQTRGICSIHVCSGANLLPLREVCDLQCPGSLTVAIWEGSHVGAFIKFCTKVPKCVEFLFWVKFIFHPKFITALQEACQPCLLPLPLSCIQAVKFYPCNSSKVLLWNHTPK